MASLRTFNQRGCDDCWGDQGRIAIQQLFNANDQLIGEFCEPCGNRRLKDIQALERQGIVEQPKERASGGAVSGAGRFTFSEVPGGDVRAPDPLDRDAGREEDAGGSGRDTALGDVSGREELSEEEPEGESDDTTAATTDVVIEEEEDDDSGGADGEPTEEA